MMQECSGTWKQFFWIETITSLGEQIWNPPKFYQFYHKFYQVFVNCTFEKCKLDNLRHYFCALIGFLKKKKLNDFRKRKCSGQLFDYSERTVPKSNIFTRSQNTKTSLSIAKF